MLGTILRAQAIVQSYWAPGTIYVMDNLLCVYFPALSPLWLFLKKSYVCVDQVVSFSGPLQYLDLTITEDYGGPEGRPKRLLVFSYSYCGCHCLSIWLHEHLVGLHQ